MQKIDYRPGRVLLSLLAVLAAALMLNIVASQANASEAPVSGKGKVKVSLTEDSLSLTENSLSDATSTNKTIDPRYALSYGRTFEEYVAAVGGSVDAFWRQTFANYGAGLYWSPNLYLLYGWAYSNCNGGYVDERMGPQYCPGDNAIYFPPFYKDRYGYYLYEWGDFAVAYVIAHEWAHHAQWLGGVDRNLLGSIQYELQADCYAGVWANSQYWEGYLDYTDIDEALNLAWYSGAPSTHGTGEQRQWAFWRGYYYGDIGWCDPYAAGSFFNGANDTTNPVISRLRPTGKIHDRTPAISAVVRDADNELAKAHIKLYLDGKRVTRFSYDQETNKLHHVSNRLAFGKHNVKVVATDVADNTATKRWSFTVVR